MSASNARPPGHRYPAVTIPDLPCEKSEKPTNLQRRPSFVHLCRSLLREWKDRPPSPDTHHRRRKRRPTANYHYREDGRVLRHRSSAISVVGRQTSPGSEKSPAAAAGGDASFIYDSGTPTFVPASRTSACTTTAYRKDSFSDIGRSPSLGARSLASFRRRLTPRDEEMSIALSLESGSIPITHISTSTCAPASPLAVHAALEEADATATLEDQLRELAMLRRASSRASTAARSQKLETAVEALDRLQPQQHKSQPSLRSCYLYNSEPPDSWIPSDNVETGSVISIPMDFVAMNPLPLSRSRYTAAPASPSSPRIGSPIARSINDMRYPGNLRWTEASAHYPIDQVQQQPAMLPSSPPPLPPKSRPVARAMYKIRRSFSALGAMFRHHGHGGGSEAETNYTQRFPSSVVPRPRAGTSGGASRRSRLYESRCSMVIKDVSPETAAEILAPGSSYAQVLASLVDRKSVDGRSVRVSTSSRISMSTVFVQSEAGDDTDSDDKDGYQGAKQMASTFVTGGHSHISNPPTPHSADTKTLKRQVGGGVSVRTALRVDTTIKVQLRRSMSEPHMTPRHSSSRANDSLPSPLIPRSQIERVPWKALGHAASFSDLDADSSSFRASSKATASRGRQRPWKVLWRRLGAGGFRPYVQ